MGSKYIEGRFSRGKYFKPFIEGKFYPLGNFTVIKQIDHGKLAKYTSYQIEHGCCGKIVEARHPYLRSKINMQRDRCVNCRAKLSAKKVLARKTTKRESREFASEAHRFITPPWGVNPDLIGKRDILR